VIEKDGKILRINSGCHEFGTENLTVDSLPTEINGQPALREDFYAGRVLRLRRFTLQNKGKCHALELYSDTNEGREELEKAARTFRVVS
jgi:hypothetical protein